MPVQRAGGKASWEGARGKKGRGHGKRRRRGGRATERACRLKGRKSLQAVSEPGGAGAVDKKCFSRRDNKSANKWRATIAGRGGAREGWCGCLKYSPVRMEARDGKSLLIRSRRPSRIWLGVNMISLLGSAPLVPCISTYTRACRRRCSTLATVPRGWFPVK